MNALLRVKEALLAAIYAGAGLLQTPKPETGPVYLKDLREIVLMAERAVALEAKVVELATMLRAANDYKAGPTWEEHRLRVEGLEAQLTEVTVREQALVTAARAMRKELEENPLDHDRCPPEEIAARWKLEQAAASALAPYAPEVPFEELLQQSSLGSPEALEQRAQTPPGVVDEIMRRADAAEQEQLAVYPCATCGKKRTKAEGGTVFTVCDACWDEATRKKT